MIGRYWIKITRYTNSPGDASKTGALFAWLISHQPAVLFSQNKPASSTLLSEQTSTSQPNMLRVKIDPFSI
jgi:hypothetical protein